MSVVRSVRVPGWDDVTDFLVVGSGGGLAAAVAARAAGLDVLVVEGTERLGGSTCMSGGVLWIPDNPLMRRDGIADSPELALRYLADVVGEAGPASSDARRRAFVEQGPRMVSFLEGQGMRFVRCEGYSDYYAEVDGFSGGSVRGRAIECVPTDTRRIGPLADRIHQSYAAPLVLRTGEAADFTLSRSRRGVAMTARVGARTVRGRLRGQRLTSNGAALITQFLEVLLRQAVPIWAESPLTDLIFDNEGRVAGAVICREGRDRRVFARHGVLLASGGFARNPELRRRYGGDQPNGAQWTHANPGDTGEALQCAIDHGAAADMLDEAWWIPTIIGPDGLNMVLTERSRPGSIIVDGSGRRFFNEAISYVEAGKQMYKRHREAGAAVPSWLILDARHRAQYPLGTMPPMVTSKVWLRNGYLKRADSLAALAQQCGIDAAGLEWTVGRFNRFAESGVDEDFHRGQGAHDRYQGDPRHTPNACLAPLTKPPFYATQIYPGDVGTSGGLVADEQSRVLSTAGEVIEGLYAAGNVSASVMGRTYPGAGASIAASTVFSFIAAGHAVGRAAAASPEPVGSTRGCS